MQLRILILAALLASLVPVPAAAEGPVPCSADDGRTDETAVRIPPVNTLPATTYVSGTQVWMEENGVPGLQKTARVCPGNAWAADRQLSA